MFGTIDQAVFSLSEEYHTNYALTEIRLNCTFKVTNKTNLQKFYNLLHTHGS